MTQKEKEFCGWFFNLVGYFNHYSFFTKKLWREVEGFENMMRLRLNVHLCIDGFMINLTILLVQSE